MTTTTAPPPAVPDVSTEFTPAQNLIIGRLGRRMRVVGTALMVLSVLLAAWSLLGAGDGSMLALEAGVLFALIGFWSRRGGTELVRVATSEGADMEHLMRALTEMRKLYDLQYWVLMAVALLLGATILMGITGAPWVPTAW